MSAALQHLRLGVTACAVALGLAIASQTVVWSMVHFTQVRTKQVDADAAPDLRVVQADEKKQRAPKAIEPAAPSQPARVEVNTVAGEGDVVMRAMAGATQTLGVFAAILLSVLMFQSISIAGGGAVPGVERAVTAATLAHLIVLMCLPLGAVLPDLAFKGVFATYSSIVAQSELMRAGGPGAPGAAAYYGQYFVLPATLLVGLLVVILRFRAGIEAGVIVTAVSQLDERIEREIRAARLGQLSTPRAVGALNAAMGDQHIMATASAAVAPAPQPIRPVPVEAVAVAPPAFRAADSPHSEGYRPGDSTKRPI